MEAKRPMMMTRATRILIAFAILVCGVMVQPADAQDVCIPDDTGVPYLGGSPNWWNDSLPIPEYWPAIDDPRWRGSFLHTPVPTETPTAHVTFRTLRNTNDLYMAWFVSVDPYLDEEDRLWLGLSPSGEDGGADDILLEIIPFPPLPPGSDKNTGEPLPAPHEIKVWTRTGPGNTFQEDDEAPLPAWLAPETTAVRVVRRCNPASGMPCDDTGSWAVLMKIPLQAPPNGIDLDVSFKFWFAVMVTHPPSSSAPFTIVEYDYPSALNHVDVRDTPNTDDWQAARRDLAPTDPGCIQGITLAAFDIGIVDSAGECVPGTTLSSAMTVDDGTGGPGTIVFCARPQNDGADIGPSDINATFRLANWGSTSRLTGTWDTINTPDCLLPTTDPTRACNNEPIATGDKGAITYQWSLTREEACSYDVPDHPVDCSGEPAPTKDDHQCILVELDGSAGVTFPVSSVARNMNFVEASTFVRDAQIGVPGPRDAFLYVDTNNMPPPRGSDFGRGKEIPAGMVAGVDPAHEPDQPPVFRFEPPADTPPLEKSPYEELRDSEPTYQVHVFHDTGRVVNLRGNNYRLLKPQPSFGYFVDHEGRLDGWNHKLDGAQEIIAGKYYKVSVPASGKATVTTSIEAVEQAEQGFAVNARVGGGLPHGSFDNDVDPGISLSVGLEYLISPAVSAEAIFGYHRFEDDGLGDDLDIYQLSVNGRYYLPKIIVWPFVNAGIGAYFLDPGDTEFGFNAGAGAQYDLTSRLSLEGAFNYHNVDTNNPDVQFSTFQLGLRYQF